ncbi:hypothetical protein SAMD00019534_095990 [Acytostelium subglobosum LB1]|uniref:hypothetical protein n=1 Tax=Acytostelium subglobosum LB1 TaxID=1410327 RepID=UPI000644F803|nr:hypothetical protein SAMD00019534_095990 [Acytostelium subglobosum LB1]GAM26424.1 hypothetical protein SAMD00019534_095990 [Acytostelium subglobosum LB1]|eukprot:XP_012750520.1 hypothetical protein SAMD00019534_095990 [Acytostelium subglobosum LB1]
MESIKSLLGATDDQPKEEPSMWKELDEQCSLSFTQRLIGAGISLGLGIFFCFLGFMFLLSPTTFAFLYTVGNLCMLASTFFIVGPMKQMKNMVQPHRLICAIVFVASMVLTLVGVFLGWLFIIIIFLVIFQICALVYYMFSYIPYGRQCLRGICGSVASSV